MRAVSGSDILVLTGIIAHDEAGPGVDPPLNYLLDLDAGVA